jgi:hypothetical protein
VRLDLNAAERGHEPILEARGRGGNLPGPDRAGADELTGGRGYERARRGTRRAARCGQRPGVHPDPAAGIRALVAEAGQLAPGRPGPRDPGGVPRPPADDRPSDLLPPGRGLCVPEGRGRLRQADRDAESGQAGADDPDGVDSRRPGRVDGRRRRLPGQGRVLVRGALLGPLVQPSPGRGPAPDRGGLGGGRGHDADDRPGDLGVRRRGLLQRRVRVGRREVRRGRAPGPPDRAHGGAEHRGPGPERPGPGRRGRRGRRHVRRRARRRAADRDTAGQPSRSPSTPCRPHRRSRRTGAGTT